MELGLRGRVVVVTGASSGIGATLAVAYGAEGARVVTTYRSNRQGAEETARQVEATGGEAMVMRFDLDDPDGASAMVRHVIGRWGGVDVLVSNALSWPQRSPEAGFEQLDPQRWRQDLRTNVEGNFALVQAVLGPMRSAGWGRILFISTGLAEEGMAGAESYTAAKAAMAGLARSLAWDLGADNILVNVLAAGLTLTERNREVLGEEVRARIAGHVPLGRLSEPGELAPHALLLTSAANTSVTGETLREGTSTGRSSHVP